MKKHLLVLFMLISMISKAQLSIYRSHDFVGSFSIGYVPVTYDSSGFLKVGRLAIANIVAAASGGGTIDTSNISNFYLKVRVGLSTVAVSGNYPDLLNKPVIPTLTSQLTNNSNFITAAVTSVSTGYGLSGGTIISTGTILTDTSSIATRSRVQKGIDSVNSNVSLKQPQLNGTGFVKVSGTSVSYDNNTYLTTAVTSVGTGYGLNGGTISTTGTLLADSFSLATRPRVQKVVDSINVNIGTKQLQLNGTGFVKVAGTVVSYDNSTYLTAAVTNVGTGFGLSGGAITSTGTLITDSFSVATRARVQKAVDSVNVNVTAKQPQLNGTGFVKASGTSITYDNSTYLTTAVTSISGGWGITPTAAITTTGTHAVDSFSVASRARVQKAVDSLQVNVNGKLSTAVTSVATGYGLSGGTISTTGTLLADSFSIASRARVQKAVDSLNANIATKGTGNGTITSITPGWGLTPQTAITSTGAPLVDSFSVASRARVQKAVDSLNANIATKGTGTVTSVTPGWGLTPQSAITTTGAPLVDSFSVAARARVQKGIDSLNSVVVPKTESLSIGATSFDLTATSRTWSIGVSLPGAVAQMSAASGAINTTETKLMNTASIAANQLTAGSTYQITLYGNCTSTVANASNFRVRIGTAGTTSDAVVGLITPTAAASGTTIPFTVSFTIQIRTTGSSGTMAGMGYLLNNGVTGVSTAAEVVGAVQSITVNTTTANIISVWYVSAATTTTSTFQVGAIECVKI